MQFIAMTMREASLISIHHSRFNDWSPVQWVDIDMMFLSVIKHHSRFNDCSAVQWADIEMMLSFVIAQDSMIAVQYNE